MSTSIIGKFVFCVGALAAASLYHTALDHKNTKSSSSDQSHHHHHGSSSHRPSVLQRTKEAEHDRITHLPGLTEDVSFEQFSGYIDAAPTRHIFYWYVESEKDPDQAPIVWWSNGGPGCSGLLGFGAEHGPFIITRKGKLHPSTYSWNKVANMLYVEQPAGVGYSYVDNPEDKVTGDAQAAVDNYQFILNFLERFPERRKNPFYLASESYGGHYIPQLALEILERDVDHKINFQGFMVGNPYVDPYTNMVAQFESYYSHGLVAKPLFDKWDRECNSPDTWETEHCDKVTDQMFDQFGDGINPYALDYPVCTYGMKERASGRRLTDLEEAEYDRRARSRRLGDTEPVDPSVTVVAGGSQRTSSAQVDALLNRTGTKPNFLPDEDAYKPCSQVNLEHYFNNKEVRDALHFFEKVEHYKWSPCGGVKYSEVDNNSPVTDLYKKLTEMALRGDHDLNMMIYSGDDDSICATAGTQAWIWNLGVNTTYLWKAWHVHSQTVGFATKFDLGNRSNSVLSFVTVHGAGHEVPSYRPMEAMEMLTRFLNRMW